MTEINKVNTNSHASNAQKKTKTIKQDEEMNVFKSNTPAQERDIGDIHGLTSMRKNGTINNVPFDVCIAFDYVTGNVNGKNVNITKNPLSYRTNYLGYVGDTPVSIKEKLSPLSPDHHYTGKYGDKKFNITYRDIIVDNRITGEFGGKPFDIEIDKNLFTADDIITKNSIPKELEEFFPIIYTIANKEKVEDK